MLNYKRVETMLSDRLASMEPTSEAYKSLVETATLGFAEHFAYQTWQSQAFASGQIDQHDATYFYRTLTESVSSFNAFPLHVRLACIMLIATVREGHM